MTLWIVLAVAAQFINAGVAILDKYIVSSEKALPRPFVYAFYTCLFAGMWAVVYFFGALPHFWGIGFPSFSNVEMPTLYTLALSLLAAYTFFLALVSLFTALRDGDASDVIPVVGAVSAVSTFFLSHIFLGARLTPNFMIGIGLLALGTFLVSRYRFTWRTALTCIHAGIFFSIHYVAIKGLFNTTSFDDGFFWSRVALVFVALSMLLVPSYMLKITAQTKSTTRQGGLLVLGTKLLAGIGTILILKATQLGSVSVVQALGGLQFVFILFFTMFLGTKTPVECGENITCNEDIYRKATFIAIITLGFFVLFV